MSPSTNADTPAPVASDEEAWVAHAALLDAGALAAEGGDSDPPQCRPLRRLERGRPLYSDDIDVLRDALIEYLGDAPIRDRAPGRSLLRRIDDAVESQSSSASPDASRKV
ncbi:hypothetical protein [Halorubrum sp. DTA46]|uniref:DUF7853 family protein n=1 Tax=Halorubrum sp. DTA46 TaxID=3402162 RepID=UPI003AAC75FE